MIFGIGTDIVAVERMEQSLARHGDAMAERILAESELLEYRSLADKRRPAFLAKRFAVKEASAKAFGLGFRNGLAMTQIAVGHDDHGKPQLQFHGRAVELFDEFAIGDTHVSISDEKGHAVAFVIFMRRV